MSQGESQGDVSLEQTDKEQSLQLTSENVSVNHNKQGSENTSVRTSRQGDSSE